MLAMDDICTILHFQKVSQFILINNFCVRVWPTKRWLCTLEVRVCTVNSFFSRRTKSEKRKTAVFRFPYAVRKSTHGFPYRFFAFLSNAKNEKRNVYRIFHVYRQYENRKMACEKRIFCVSCVTFNTEWEKRKTTSWTVFLIPRAQRKTKSAIRFVFHFSYFSLHTEWEKRVAPLSFYVFCLVKSCRKWGMRKMEILNVFRVSFSLLSANLCTTFTCVTWLFGGL